VNDDLRPLPRRLAAWYQERVLAGLPLVRRQRARVTLVWNGLVFALGGVVLIVLFDVLLGLFTHGLVVLTSPAFWFLGFLGGGMSAVGWLAHRVGRALPRE
jgi:hypothetical protein